MIGATGSNQIKAIKQIKAIQPIIICLIDLIALIVLIALICMDPVAPDKLKQLHKLICDRTHWSSRAVGSEPIRSH